MVLFPIYFDRPCKCQNVPNIAKHHHQLSPPGGNNCLFLQADFVVFTNVTRCQTLPASLSFLSSGRAIQEGIVGLFPSCFGSIPRM